MEVRLRNYQEEGVRAIKASFALGHQRVLFTLPTGGGKTVCFSYIAQQAVAKGNRVCILVHRQELVDQASRSLEAMGIEHGVIAATYPMRLKAPVQVASVQTLARRLRIVGPDAFSLVIVDEAHHAVAGQWSKCLDFFDARVLGVTATPQRLDGLGMAGQFDDLVVGPGPAWLTEQGHLCRARVFSPPVQADFSQLNFRAGDYAIDQVAAAMQTTAVMGDAVKHFQQHLGHGTAIAFCCTVDHCHAVAEAFNQAGIAAAVVDGKMHKDERRRMIEALGTGEIRVLCSCNIVSEGTDIPSVTGCLLLRKTASLSLYLQQVGRCLRPAPGKDAAIILDHVGNVHEHGLPSQGREWTLEGKKRRKTDRPKAPSVRVCEECFAAIASKLDECPECGAVRERKTGTIESIEGNLEEMDHAKAMRSMEAVERRKKMDLRKEVGRARSLQQLKAIAQQRGYAPGWAEHVFKSRRQQRNAQP